MKKMFISVIMALAMMITAIAPAFAVETEAADFSAVSVDEQVNTASPYVTPLYSGEGYTKDGNFPATGTFKVSSKGEVRISYGFAHDNASGSSHLYLTLNKKTLFGQWNATNIVVELTADQKAQVESLGTLSSGEYQFVLQGTSGLAYGTVTIYRV